MESKLKGNYRKTSPGGISKDRNKVGASFKIGDLYLFFIKKQIALIKRQACNLGIAKTYVIKGF